MEDEKLNWANVMRGFEESKKRNEELAAQMAAQLAAQMAAQLAAQAALMAEIGVRMDAMLDRLEKMFAESKVEQDAQTAAMRAEVAGIGKSNGMFAEDVYFRALWRRKEFAGIHFDDVSDRMKSKIMLPDGKKLEDEFDIVMTNAASVAIVETKFRAREEDVKELAETVAKNFRLLFPAYKDFKIYLGLGALAFEDKAVKKAREFGIGLIRRVEDNIVYAADWEVKAY